MFYSSFNSSYDIRMPSDEEKLKTNPFTNENQFIELFSDLNLVIALTLLDEPRIHFTPSYISQKLNISILESDRVLKKLIAMELIVPTEKSDVYEPKTVYIDDGVNGMFSAAIAKAYSKTMYRTFSNITTNDVFNFRLEILSRKVIQKNISKVNALISRITEESKSEKSKEVYSFSQVFVEAKN